MIDSHSTSSTAQVGGGSFLKQETYRRGWLFGVVAMVAVVASPQLLDVVWCSAVVVVGAVVVVM